MSLQHSMWYHMSTSRPKGNVEVVTHGMIVPELGVIIRTQTIAGTKSTLGPEAKINVVEVLSESQVFIPEAQLVRAQGTENIVFHKPKHG